MIHVIASVRVKTGMLPDYLEIFKANMAKVREEREASESGLMEGKPCHDAGPLFAWQLS